MAPRDLRSWSVTSALLVLAACPGEKSDTTGDSSGGSTGGTTTEGLTGPAPTDATTGAAMTCADAKTPEACAGAPSNLGECAWTQFFTVSTADMMCTAEPKDAACVDVPINDGGCGPCHYKVLGPDMYEVAVLPQALNCNEFMAGEFVSCDADPDNPEFACSCACK